MKTLYYSIIVILFSMGAGIVFAQSDGETKYLTQQNIMTHNQSGIAFDTPINLSRDGNSQDPQVASSENNVYVIWDSFNSGVEHVYFEKSSDSGTTFEDPIDIKTGGSEPHMVVSGNNIFVACLSGNDVYFAMSADGGKTFSSTINISAKNHYSSATINYNPKITASGNNVYVEWMTSNYDWVNVFVAKSTDAGSTFGDPINVSNSKTYEQVQQPDIVASGNDAYAVWQVYNNHVGPPYGYISMKKISPDGNMILNLTQSRDGYSAWEPHIYVDKNNVFALWRDEIKENGITFAKSMDGGKIFVKKYLGRSGSLASANPWQVASDKNQYITWTDGTDIFFAKSNDDITEFSNPINLSNNTWGLNPYDNIPLPQLVISGNNVFASWRYTVSPDGNHALYFSASSDGGKTFDSPLKLSQNSGDLRGEPKMTASGSHVYAVYSYTTTGNDVFLVKGTLQGSTDLGTPTSNDHVSDNIFEQILNWLKQIFHLRK